MPSGEGRMTRGRMRELGGMEQKGTEKFQTTTIAMQRDAVTGGEKLRDNSTIVLAIEEERAQDEEPTIAHHVPSKTDAGAMQLNVSNVLQTEGQNDLEARTASPVGEEVVVGQLLPCYEHLVHEQINNTELESHLETTLRAFYDGFFQGRRENHYISLYSPALPSKSYGNSDREGAGSQRFLLQPLTKEPILFVEALGTHSPTTPPETPSQQQDKPCIRTEIGTELCTSISICCSALSPLGKSSKVLLASQCEA
ncbi:hypothetical protein B0J14DRAFT_23005 [Halenospora varia]|nr:hypothetical protein B0J14DRAFT_23005 [Halenospora varia]